LAAQGLDRDQEFGGEFPAVPIQKVGLNVTRTSPLKTAEQAAARLLVYVFPVTGEFLRPSKASVANGTDHPRPAACFATAAADVLTDYTPSGSVGLNLEYVSLH
jgi:hypothetical protein